MLGPAEKLTLDLQEALTQQPLIDAHTHLDARHLTARGLHDLLLYHMVISDLYSAGCPSGARLSENPDDREAAGRIEEALPFLPLIENTSCCWGLRILLRDLYGWSEPVTSDNWRRLDRQIWERSTDLAWAKEITSRAKIRHSGTEWVRRDWGQADGLLFYSLEWAFFARGQWGEFDTALYELERTWTQERPEPPLPVTLGKRREAERSVRTLQDVNDALDHYAAVIPYDRLVSTAQHLSTDIDYRPVSDDEMGGALARRDRAGQAERDIYAGYILEGFLTRLERRPQKIVFQFSLGAEPLPFETASRLYQRTLTQLAEMIARHPALHFQCFVASLHANQTLCTLARELPNFSLAGYWWHNFFPCFIRRIMAERLDMLPANKQIGFFSDAYCLEWAYAKAQMVRKMLAGVLAEKVTAGQYDQAMALRIAHGILFNSPRQTLKMIPASHPVEIDPPPASNNPANG